MKLEAVMLQGKDELERKAVPSSTANSVHTEMEEEGKELSYSLLRLQING